jgi:hypothetical protein
MTNSSTSQKTEVPSPAGPSDDPAHLAAKIKKELETCKEHSQFLTEHAIQLGELLIQAKKAVGHGRFYQWLDQNCHLEKRQAQRYMLLAKHRDRFEGANASRATHLSLRAALAVLAKELDENDESSSDEQKDQKDPDADYRVELAKHKKRCEDFKRLQQDETSITAGPALKQAVKEGMDRFVTDLVKAARRHGKKLATRKLQEAGIDQDLTAMVLAADASERLDPLKDFSPKEPIT